MMPPTLRGALRVSLWLGALASCTGPAASPAESPDPTYDDGKADDARDLPSTPDRPDAPAPVPAGVETITTLTHVLLDTELSLGARNAGGILCPDPQILSIGGTYVSQVTKDGERTTEVASLCGLDVPSFQVSAHGAIGGCDQVQDARLGPAFDVAEVAQKSTLDVPLADMDAMPVAFVLGAELEDPFSEPLPDWSTPARWRDDDGDGNPGVTLIADGLPILPDGAELYATVRLLVTPTAPDHAEASIELELIGSNVGLSGHALDFIAPNLRAAMVVSYVREQVSEDMDCGDVASLTGA